MWLHREFPRRTIKKAPLCKGSSRAAGEGLFRYIVDLQIFQNDSKTAPPRFAAQDPPPREVAQQTPSLGRLRFTCRPPCARVS